MTDYGQVLLEADRKGPAPEDMSRPLDETLVPLQTLSDLEGTQEYQDLGYKLWNYVNAERTKRADDPYSFYHDTTPTSGREYAQWLSDRYRWGNNNSGSMALNIYRFGRMPRGLAKEFAHGWAQYDATDNTPMDVVSAVGAQVGDPLNIIGVMAAMPGSSIAAIGKGWLMQHLKTMATRAATNPTGRFIGNYGMAVGVGAAEGGATGYLSGKSEDVLDETAGNADRGLAGSRSWQEALISAMVNLGIFSALSAPKKTAGAVALGAGAAAESQNE